MKNREQIEGELIVATALLHEQTLIGVSAGSMREIRGLMERIETLLDEATRFTPQIVKLYG